MSALNRLSRELYRASRLTRDANAIARGPQAVGKRVARKALGRTYGRLAGRLFR